MTTDPPHSDDMIRGPFLPERAAAQKPKLHVMATATTVVVVGSGDHHTRARVDGDGRGGDAARRTGNSGW